MCVCVCERATWSFRWLARRAPTESRLLLQHSTWTGQFLRCRPCRTTTWRVHVHPHPASDRRGRRRRVLLLLGMVRCRGLGNEIRFSGWQTLSGTVVCTYVCMYVCTAFGEVCGVAQDGVCQSSRDKRNGGGSGCMTV